MDQLADKTISIDFDELSTFDYPMEEKFRLIVRYNSVQYEFLIQFKYNSEKLVCLALENKFDDDSIDNSIPYLNIENWAFNDSTIFCNDPASYLSKDLPEACGIGYEEDYYLENIAEICLRLAKRIHLEGKDICFFGSSMGGFASIQLATMVRESTAIADMPQFFLQNHLSFDKICENAFPDKSKDYIMEHYRYRFDVLNMMVREDYIPNAIIILDCSDMDIDSQYIDFIKGIRQLPFISNRKNHIKILFNYRSDHSPLDNAEITYLVNHVASGDMLCYLEEIEDSSIYIENQELKAKTNEMKETLVKWGGELYNLSANDRIREMTDQINHLTNELEDSRKEIERLHSQIEERNSVIECFKTSKSWKITKPLRKLMKLLK